MVAEYWLNSSYNTIMIFNIGVRCGNLSCHSCLDVLTNQVTPNCSRTVEPCDDQHFFCGVAAQYINNSIFYKESCVLHDACSNTTAQCPKTTCFLYCCDEGLCNEYDQVNLKRSINVTLVNMMQTESTSTVVKPTSTLGIESTPVVITVTSTVVVPKTNGCMMSSLTSLLKFYLILLLTVTF